MTAGRGLVSPRTRRTLAMVLAIIALAIYTTIMLILVTQDVDWLSDFEAYYSSSARLASGGSLYMPEQLAGPFDAICERCYLYPPPFGQLLVPLTAVPLAAAKAIWFALMLTSGWLSVWLALSIGGAARTIESAAWSLVAVAFYLPAFHSIWMGNVGTLLGLFVVMVALGGTLAGVGAALATVLKVAPGTLVPVALVADRRSAISMVVTLVAVMGASYVFSPQMWVEYPTVLVNMIVGGGEAPWNLAPVQMATRAGVDGLGLGVVRAIAVVAGVATVGAAVWVARRPGGLPLAVLLASIAMLIVPGTLWYHYLSVVVPLVALAWPRTGRVERVVLVIAAIMITIAGSPLLPLEVALVAAGIMLAITGRALWAAMAQTGIHAADHTMTTGRSPTPAQRP